MSLASVSSVEDSPAVHQDLWMAIWMSAYGVGHREKDELDSPWHMFVDCSLYNKKEFQLVSVSYNRTGCIEYWRQSTRTWNRSPTSPKYPGLSTIRCSKMFWIVCATLLSSMQMSTGTLSCRWAWKSIRDRGNVSRWMLVVYHHRGMEKRMTVQYDAMTLRLIVDDW